MPNPIHRPLPIAVLGACVIPGAAMAAAPMHVGDVFVNAAVVPKLIMAALVVSAVAAVVVATGKLLRGERLAGGSVFVAGLRFGGPAAGVLGAAYTLTNMAIGVANVPYEPTLKALAPGIAEIAVLLGLGFAAGVIAAIMNWALEARIDRQVLGG